MDDFWKMLITTLGSAGVAGAVLGWYLIKFEPAMQSLILEMRTGFVRISTAIYLSSKADMLRMIASPHVADSVKEAAADLVKEIKDEESKTAAANRSDK